VAGFVMHLVINNSISTSAATSSLIVIARLAAPKVNEE